jgi:hypothetical protein
MLSDCGYLNILSAIGVGEKKKEKSNKGNTINCHIVASCQGHSRI